MVRRGQFVRDQLNQRMTSLLGENLELLAIIQELQNDAKTTRNASNGEVPTPRVPAEVTS